MLTYCFLGSSGKDHEIEKYPINIVVLISPEKSGKVGMLRFSVIIVWLSMFSYLPFNAVAFVPISCLLCFIADTSLV